MKKSLKNQNILISVILPVYNGEKYLVEAIESILTQTHENFEFIIINDGSTDNTLKIIEKYREKDNRIVLISRENKGLARSLNEGINLSKGQYIARMDADDISIDIRLETQINFIRNNELDIIGSHYIVIDDNNVKERVVFMPIKEELISLQFLNTVPVAHPSVMFNKEFLLQHKLEYEDMPAEDYHLWSHMYSLGASFSNCDDFLLLYRKNMNSFSSTKRIELKNDRKEIVNSFFQKNRQSILESIEKSVINKSSYLVYEREIIIKAMFFLVFKKKYFSYLKRFIYFFNKADFVKLVSYFRSLL